MKSYEEFLKETVYVADHVAAVSRDVLDIEKFLSGDATVKFKSGRTGEDMLAFYKDGNLVTFDHRGVKVMNNDKMNKDTVKSFLKGL